MQYVEPAKQFAKDSIRLVKRCTKPDRKGKNVFSLIFLSYVLSFMSLALMCAFCRSAQLIRTALHNLFLSTHADRQGVDILFAVCLCVFVCVCMH